MHVAAILLSTGVLVFGAVAQDSDTLANLESTVCSLGRQLMLQQLFVEERIRSDGSSGLKQIRNNKGGTRPYHSPSHTLGSVASIHDHANNKYTMGMGEVIAVLNGVEFRTRHNDYKLKQPSTTSQTYHATEYIKLPDVPQSVLDKPGIAEQIVEMREYFKAWRDEDVNHRNYLPYFKPVLCYMEGAWLAGADEFDESFESDRHFLEAKSWFDLQEKIRFTSMTGLKNNLENYAYLPTTIMNMTDDCLPVFAQWNYRILCHPIEREFRVNNLKVADDLASRMARKFTMEQHLNSRAARFRVNGKDGEYTTESFYNYGPIDEIMYEIPGKQNYQGILNETGFNLLAYEMNNRENALNAARYHRIFRHGEVGAMGISKRHRGYADEWLYVALNEQAEVSPISVTDCDGDDCNTFMNRVSYAIPLEIIYLTPLMQWNPYDIEFKEGRLPQRTVTADGRDGSTEEKALNGSRNNLFYRTPSAFFQGSEIGTDPADTVSSFKWVLNKTGNPNKVVASGTRIFLPEINGIGTLRTRFPIPPIHGEGRAVWKEVDALKEVVNNLDEYGYLLENKPDCLESTGVGMVHLQLGESVSSSPHMHELFVTEENFDAIIGNKTVQAYTEISINHQHNVEIGVHSGTGTYYIVKCDGHDQCQDKHPNELKLVV